MTDSVIELRDLNLELESLKARKEKMLLKSNLLNTVIRLTDEQIATSTTEATEVRDAIKSVEEKIKTCTRKSKCRKRKKSK